ncbi:30S ribosomal protein S4 [Haloquadratum walsbyi]|jgi:small subunit ribosomal protein S4|uniref:Small ribosomal subunit protein uS4 n=2 Tax=Haloquadratum walsbyi TaxID=293091 RepID=RS4_HALWD|nr:30S ribosomal protein S4 [Haloquadratum walsbyi]Q18G54.1 RecName: Full=Small ribosomal subunit protein uS4; AltName: Full=30S ribosomal protein S4 [Haloquadratum walsbyi DSM 16790]CAJ53047.1 30S ribosomal protein S4 [Haloquadratum walsbyi DSM 16790]CCC41129.1 30S ribosomal protein S4 [Haloquadratum walsbyi C23]
MSTGSNTKRYETPNHPYQGERIAQEGDLLGRYGLKNKEELWRTQSELREYRREARRLIGEAQGDVSVAEALGEEFLDRLRRYGILSADDDISKVLGLDVSDILERRLQTIVYRQGLASTPKQARQFIVHEHITVNGARVTRPSKMVEETEANAIAFDENSPLADSLHPARAEGQE